MYKLDYPFVNVIKEATVMKGIDISTHVQAPASPLNEEKKGQLKSILQRASLL